MKNISNKTARIIALLLYILPIEVFASAEGSGHSDLFASVLLMFFIVLLMATIGRALARAMGQAPVLGELVIGVIIGNIGYWLGRPFFTIIMEFDTARLIVKEAWRSGLSYQAAAEKVIPVETLHDAEGPAQAVLAHLTGPNAVELIIMVIALWIFSNLGVILLLFMVGLESSVGEMRKVGSSALLVASIGVVVPFALGYGSAIWLLPDANASVHLFLAATLCATSVGITARVFKDMGCLHIPEAKVILGAAVIDDVMSLVILAIVVGIIASGVVDVTEVGRIAILSLAFILVIMFFGERLVGLKLAVFRRIERNQTKLLFPLVVAFFMAWLANQIELATIVGAFAAGLILSESHFKDHDGQGRSMEELIQPLENLFAPIFFVLMGMQVNLSSFAQPGTLGLAVALCVIAIVSKVVAGIAAGKGRSKLTVGFGMMPRGEVGLIFVSIGKALGVVTDAVFAAVVIMVIVTTLIAPIALKWSIARQQPA